ncbi:uncharacterized protein LOC110346294 isoform X2 [Heterocephalus glaber]|uniref:Uncharacterized protein LOC110346294 isoform X2 n=1 Tax=Heterocephalus glaber TaxID=10181 RepID=A0AAX6S2T4_HETGA|nr:uncharacterized protein LOC110346294 isoform X2 [Heterocephalus glaber]
MQCELLVCDPIPGHATVRSQEQPGAPPPLGTLLCGSTKQHEAPGLHPGSWPCHGQPNSVKLLDCIQVPGHALVRSQERLRPPPPSGTPLFRSAKRHEAPQLRPGYWPHHDVVTGAAWSPASIPRSSPWSAKQREAPWLHPGAWPHHDRGQIRAVGVVRRETDLHSRLQQEMSCLSRWQFDTQFYMHHLSWRICQITN